MATGYLRLSLSLYLFVPDPSLSVGEPQSPSLSPISSPHLLLLLLLLLSLVPSSPLDSARAHYGAPCSAYNAPATVLPPLFLATPFLRIVCTGTGTRLRACMSTGVTLMTHERIITEPPPIFLSRERERKRIRERERESERSARTDGSFKCRLGYRKLTSR